MAEISILDINLEELRDKIAGLRQELSQLEVGTEDYYNKLQEVKDATGELNNAVASQSPAMNELKETLKGLKEEWANANSEAERGSIASLIGVIEGQIKDMNLQLKTAAQSATSAEGSYNDLVNLMRSLQQQAKATGDEVERIQISGKIKEINDQLKSMDAEMGNYQRNVGDYAGQLTQAFGLMGISLGGAEKAFQAASAASVGFKGSLDLLKAHPFIAVATVLVGTMIKLKDAIGKNEEHSKRWKVAMAAFQPILNAVTNAIDWLAGKLVDVMVWVSNNLPKGLKSLGSFSKGTLNIIGNIVDAITFIPKTLAKVMGHVTDLVFKGVNALAGKVADILSAVGLDDWAAKVTGVAKSAGDAVKSFYSGAENFFAGAGDAVRKLGVSIDNAMTKAAGQMKYNMDLQKQENKLVDQQRQLEVDIANSKARQADLQERIAKAKGKEKQALLEQLKQEIQSSNAQQVAQAEAEYQLAMKRAALAPNSKEDNDALNTQLANIIKLRSEGVQAAAAVTKKIEQGADKAEKAANKVGKASKKAAEDTSDKLEKVSKKYQKIYKEIDVSETKYQKGTLDYYNNALSNANKKRDAQLKEIGEKLELGLITEQEFRAEAIRIYEEWRKTSIEIDNTITNLKKIEEYKKKVNELRINLFGGTPEERYKAMEAELNMLDDAYQAQIQMVAGNEAEINRITQILLEERQKIYQRYGKSLEEAAAGEPNKAFNWEGMLRQVSLVSGTIGHLTESIVDAWDATIQAQLAAGKITEEEAEHQFEQLKKFEIASAVVNTIAGSISAFMGTWADKTIQPIWLRAALAGTNAASVLAAGYAQIQQIKSTSIGSAGGSSSSSFTVANATPLLNEAQDVNNLTSLNVTGDNEKSDQRVYILQSDIINTTKQSKVRVEQSTF